MDRTARPTRSSCPLPRCPSHTNGNRGNRSRPSRSRAEPVAIGLVKTSRRERLPAYGAVGPELKCLTTSSIYPQAGEAPLSTLKQRAQCTATAGINPSKSASIVCVVSAVVCLGLALCAGSLDNAEEAASQGGNGSTGHRRRHQVCEISRNWQAPRMRAERLSAHAWRCRAGHIVTS